MFPKGGMGKLMKQAQEMQAKMAKAQDEIVDLTVDGQSGGGMVNVVVNGKKNIISLSIDPEILEEDTEMIEDLILSAVNQGLQNAEKVAEEKMASITGGLNIPGM